MLSISKISACKSVKKTIILLEYPIPLSYQKNDSPRMLFCKTGEMVNELV